MHNATTRWRGLRYSGQWGRHTANSLPWTPGEQSLASSRHYSVESSGKEPWRGEGPKDAGWYSRITFSMLRHDASRQGGNWAKMPAGLHGWVRRCWANSERKKKLSEGGNEDRWLWRNRIKRKIVQGDRDKVRETRAQLGSSVLHPSPAPLPIFTIYFYFPLYHIYCYIKLVLFTLAHSVISTLIQAEASL